MCIIQKWFSQIRKFEGAGIEKKKRQGLHVNYIYQKEVKFKDRSTRRGVDMNIYAKQD